MAMFVEAAYCLTESWLGPSCFRIPWVRRGGMEVVFGDLDFGCPLEGVCSSALVGLLPDA